MVSGIEFEKSLMEYLPIISQPTKYNACKYFFDGLDKLIDNLQLIYFLGHAGEKVFSQISTNYMERWQCEQKNVLCYW